MSAGFTPGPWFGPNFNTTISGVASKAMLGKFKGKSGYALRVEVSGDNMSADAHLIHAAPELYDALARCHAIFIGDDTETPIAQIVDAALAKARGEA